MSTLQGILFCVGYAVLLAAAIVGTLRVVFGRELWTLLRRKKNHESVRFGQGQYGRTLTNELWTEET